MRGKSGNQIEAMRKNPRRNPVGQLNPVSMMDVARLAGVSGMTVSRVMRAEKSVLPATAELVNAAIAKLGYIPNVAAATLAHNRSRAIGVVVPTLAGAIFADAVQGLTDVLGAAGYTVILGCDNYDAETHHSMVNSLVGRRVEGLVLHSSDQLPKTRQLLERGHFPVLQIWELARQPFDITVGVNQREAGYALTQHLIGPGCRDVAFVQERVHAYQLMFDRRTGYLAAIAEAGLQPRIELIDYVADMDGGVRLVRELAQAGRMPDGLFLHNDFSSAGALFEAQRLGLAVGTALRLATFSYTSLPALTNPGISSLSVDCREMGRISARALLTRLSGAKLPKPSVDLGFEIIRRGTS